MTLRGKREEMWALMEMASGSAGTDVCYYLASGRVSWRLASFERITGYVWCRFYTSEAQACYGYAL